MSGDSRSDLQALQRSGQTKVVALALLMVGALAAAAWLLVLKPHGEGNPERSDKVLIVRGTQVAGYSGALGRMGFDAAEGTLAHWAEKTSSELPEFEGSAVQGVLALADRYGYGFVAFENPAAVDFDGVDLESAPAFSPQDRFAVISVGDFASPHHVTINGATPEALRRREFPLVDALFQQRELSKTLPGSEIRDMDTLQRRSQLERAITLLQLRESTDALAHEVREAWREATAPTASVQTVGVRSLETAVAQPLPDGRLLTAVEPFEIITRDGVRADLERAREQHLYADAGRERTRCSAISQGTVDADTRLSFSARAQALVLGSAAGSTLWQWDAHAPTDACGFRPAGAFEGVDLSAETIAVAEGGTVAFVRTSSGSEAALWSVDAGDEAGPNTHPRVELGKVSASDPAWVDSEHIAVVWSAGEGPTTLGLFSARGELRRFEVELPGLPSGVHAIAPAGPRALLLTAPPVGDKDGGAWVWRVEAPRPWSELVEPPVDGGDSTPEDAAAPPEAWSVRPLTHGGDARDVTVSADGTRAAFVWSALGEAGEVVVANAVESGPLVALTADPLDDRAPRFDDGGTRLVFQTRRGVPKTAWTVSIPRSVAVPPTVAERSSPPGA